MRLEEVVGDPNAGKDLSAPEFFTSVAVARLDSKLTSKALVLLSDALPLTSFGLDHLKRVRKVKDNSAAVEVVLGSTSTVSSLNKEFWGQLGLSIESTVLEHPNVSVETVPRYEPNNRQEFALWCQTWPINFHPGELERCRSKGVDTEELAYVEGMVQALLSLPRDEEGGDEELHAALLADPASKMEICTSSDALTRLRALHGLASIATHPLYPPTLLVIDQLSSIAKNSCPGQERLPVGHYLATGLDLFVTHEPNLFACMALVHSRIRRVYFVHADALQGALLSGNGRVHCLRALNHHYRVFQVHPGPSVNPTPSL